MADGYLGFGKSADEIWFQAVLGATMALFSTSVDGTSRENLGVRGTLFERSSTGDLAFLRTAQDDDEVYVAIMLKSAEKPARPVGPTGFRVKTHETLFFWSPDGRWLAVRGTSTKKGGRAWLYVLDATAQAPKFRRLIRIATTSAGLAWSPDSRRIAVQAYRNPSVTKRRRLSPNDLRLMQVHVPSGRQSELLKAGSGCSFWTPAWSEHGLAVAYDCGKSKRSKARNRRLRIYRMPKAPPSRR